MTSVLAAILGTLIVGLEDEPDGSLRVYLGARYTGVHTHVDDPESIANLKREWSAFDAAHLFTHVPPESICNCPSALENKPDPPAH